MDAGDSGIGAGDWPACRVVGPGVAAVDVCLGVQPAVGAESPVAAASVGVDHGDFPAGGVATECGDQACGIGNGEQAVGEVVGVGGGVPIERAGGTGPHVLV